MAAKEPTVRHPRQLGALVSKFNSIVYQSEATCFVVYIQRRRTGWQYLEALTCAGVRALYY